MLGRSMLCFVICRAVQRTRKPGVEGVERWRDDERKTAFDAFVFVGTGPLRFKLPH